MDVATVPLVFSLFSINHFFSSYLHDRVTVRSGAEIGLLSLRVRH